MEKIAKPQDPESNAAKVSLNAKASELLHLDEDAVNAVAKKLVKAISAALGDDVLAGVDPRVLVTGAAGSGKTTLAKSLAKELGVKGLDFDEYIPGGFTTDSEEYARRFNKGLYELWDDVPQKKGWVIEHVEACSPDLVGLYNPDFAILVDPGEEHLRSAAEARTAIAGSGDGRLVRALQSNKKAKSQFNALAGEIILKLPGYLVKQVEG